MQVFGHCRFSWFGISDTGRELTSVDDAAARLWHPLRMAIRFHLFEGLMLPSLAVQTDSDFRLLVTCSPEMPQTFQTRLDALAVRYPFIQLNRTYRRYYHLAARRFMRDSTDNKTRPAVHFRLDDDDAVPCDYIARLRRDATRVDVGGIICYPRGIVGFLDGAHAKHGYRTIPYHAQGIARVAGPGMLESPIQMQHRAAGNNLPSFVDPTFIGFHFTKHGVNNTRGYGEIVHGAETTTARNMAAINPELAEGKAAPAQCDADLAERFPFSDGPGIRRLLEETLDPAALAVRYGFADRPDQTIAG